MNGCFLREEAARPLVSLRFPSLPRLSSCSSRFDPTYSSIDLFDLFLHGDGFDADLRRSEIIVEIIQSLRGEKNRPQREEVAVSSQHNLSERGGGEELLGETKITRVAEKAMLRRRRGVKMLMEPGLSGSYTDEVQTKDKVSSRRRRKELSPPFGARS